MVETQNKLAVVILNWNGLKYLKEFIPILIKYSSIEGVGLYIADNGSKDESVNYLKQNHPEINLILLEKNYGFAEGYNKALEKVDSEYFVLLNSDVEVTEGWIEPLIKLMDSDSEIAACMPKIMDYYMRDYFEYAGAAGGFIDKYAYPFCRGRIFDEIEKDNGQYNNFESIFWASGACLFIRKDIYFKAGGLDGNFFAHMEEIDLCWRIKNMGHKIMFCPESKVYHVGGGTLSKNNPKKTYLNFRNNLYLLYKNLPEGKVFSLIFFRMILDGIAGVKFLIGFEFSNFWAIIKAHFSFYRNVSRFSEKRQKNIKTLFITYDYPEKKNFSIVYSFFVKKLRLYSKLYNAEKSDI
ncbi:MAG: glycosyl transferase family 2 [Bacteroidetes bacterium GWA2_31_9]|nr:MAG: glycosyl transferase family 2 [Bacteroidetes bacterium GWA2_31_9]